jgi:glycerol-3-phosphate dehydrogenase
MSSRYGPLATEVAKHCLRSERGLEVACSCEYVLRGELDFFAKDEDVRGLDDLMRRTRAGMGYCQGGLCVMKLASVLHERKKCDAREVIGTFLEERAKGIEMVLEGPQLRQEVLKMYLLAGTYGLRKQGGEG